MAMALLLVAGLAALAAAALPAAAASATRQGAAGVGQAKGPPGEVAQLVQRFRAARRQAAREFTCLITPACATDEGRWLDALEAGRVALQGLAEHAGRGDAEAAYQRGLLGLEVAEGHAERRDLREGAQFPHTARVLNRRLQAEQREAERFLAMAAAAGHAEACFALAEHLAAQREPLPAAGLASHLYRCAVQGRAARDDLVGAAAVYARMRGALDPRDPLLVEAHALVHRGLKPERPWRLVEPEQAEALRRIAAP